jgi:hypothetical protein
MSNVKGLLPKSLGANIKEFLVTILSEVKRPQTQCLSPKGEFWVCSETNSRMVRNSFQRAKGGLGNSQSKFDVGNPWKTVKTNSERNGRGQGPLQLEDHSDLITIGKLHTLEAIAPDLMG